MTTPSPGEPGWYASGPATAPPPIAPGPGVIPPFAAPPREGHRRRLGTGIAIGAVILVLCCGGGATGIAALVITTTNQRLHDARAVVTAYMDDWRKQDYGAAYQLLCEDQKKKVALADFANDLGQNQVTEFTVEDPVIQSNAVEVPVRVSFEDGGNGEPTFDVVVDSERSSRICGTH